MNLIFCNASCIYQKEGYCTLENSCTVTSYASNDCCFFTPKYSENEKQQRRS